MPPALFNAPGIVTPRAPPAVMLPAWLSMLCALTVASPAAVSCPWFDRAPADTPSAPFVPIKPPAPFTNAPVAVRLMPSALSETMRPAVLSSDAARMLSRAAACIVPPRLFTLPAVCKSSVDCETSWPFAFETLPALTCMEPPLDSLPPSLVSVPAAVTLSAPPAVVVAFARFMSPLLAASVSALLADVLLPARLTDAPRIVVLPPPSLRPVATTAPVASTLNSPLLAIVPSWLTPAPSVPVEATLPALIVVSCCAASMPVFVNAPEVVAMTLPWA